VGAYIAFIRLQVKFQHHLDSCIEKNEQLETVLKDFHLFLSETRILSARNGETLLYLKDEMTRTRTRLHALEGSVASSEKAVMSFLRKYAPKQPDD
jgi:predicted nuclease with TOPRIM domain